MKTKFVNNTIYDLWIKPCIIARNHFCLSFNISKCLCLCIKKFGEIIERLYSIKYPFFNSALNLQAKNVQNSPRHMSDTSVRACQIWLTIHNSDCFTNI